MTMTQAANGFKRAGQTDSYTEDRSAKKVRYAEEESEEEEEDSEEDEEEEEDSEEENSGEESDGQYEKTSDMASKEHSLMARSREMATFLKNARAKAAREDGLKDAREYMDKINALFEEKKKLGSSNKTIEVYDSRNVFESGNLMDIAIRNIKLGTGGGVLAPDDYIKRLKTYLLNQSFQTDPDADDDPEVYYNNRHDFKKFNWFQLGTFLYSRGNRAVTTNHLLGPLEIEKKVRVFKERKVDKPVGDLVTAEKVTGEDINGQSTNQTPNAVQECYKVFHQKSQGKQINIFKFFINPNSFPQSIENMFYTSFLIRDGRLQLGEDEEGYPTVSELPPLPEDQREREQVLIDRRDRPSNHIIFQLEYESWKNLIEKLNITESYLPERN